MNANRANSLKTPSKAVSRIPNKLKSQQKSHQKVQSKSPIRGKEDIRRFISCNKINTPNAKPTNRELFNQSANTNMSKEGLGESPEKEVFIGRGVKDMNGLSNTDAYEDQTSKVTDINKSSSKVPMRM